MNKPIKEHKGRNTIKKTFLSFLEYRKMHVRDSSIRSARSAYNTYLAKYEKEEVTSFFSSKKITKVYKEIIGNKNICSKWKNRIIGVMREYSLYLYKRKKVPSRVYQDVISVLENIKEEEKSKPNKKEIWNKIEERKFLEAVEEKHKTMFFLFLDLGLRLGEFLGLTWDCVDLKRGRVEIKQQLLNASQKTYVLSSLLKTKQSYRVCILSRVSLAKLKELGEKEKKEGFLFKSSLNPSLPLSKANFRYLFDKYILLAGIKRITPHAIRHMKASKLMKECKNMLEVTSCAKFMGHSVSMMMNTYSHAEEELIEVVLRRIENKEKS